jgi:uncharacterized protein (TIGR03437 family)
MRKSLRVLLCSFSVYAAFGQSNILTLSSGTAAVNGAVSLSLNLASSTGSAPTALQWSFTYPAGNVSSVTATSGASATNAGKTLQCVTGLGVYTCLTSGLNSNAIQNGTIATLNLIMATTANPTSIAVVNALGASSSGQPISISGTGGTVSGPGGSQTVQVSVSPSSATISAGQTQQLTASVTGSGNTAVTWGISPSVGTINSSGLYTAPASISATQTVIATATTVADTSQSANAAITLQATATTPTVSFLKTDTTTQGTWRGVYGNDGYTVVSDQASNPSYGTPVTAGQLTWVWSSSTSNVRALQKASNPSSRIAAAWYNNTPFTIDLNFTDSTLHQIAVYCLDWDSTSRRQRMDILDASGNILNTQSLTTSFHRGVYLVWSVSGHVQIRVTWTGGVNAVVSGVFFDASPAQTKVISSALPVFKRASKTAAATVSGVAVGSQEANAGLFCSPRTVAAGSQVRCELRVTASAIPMPLPLTSSSNQVKLPAFVSARPHQTSLTFQASVESTAHQETATVTAVVAGSQPRDSIVVTPGAGPVLKAPASLLGVEGVPVQFTVSVADPSDLPVQITSSPLPQGASFDAASGVFLWTPSVNQIGKYAIRFTATNAAQSTTSVQTALTVSNGTPVLTSAQPLSCSPGAIGNVTGEWLTLASKPVSDPSGATFELGGIKVQVNNQFVTVLSVSSSQASFVCPILAPGTQLSLIVQSSAGQTPPLTGSMQFATPTILSLDGSGQGQGMVSFLDGEELAMERNYRLAAHPAQPGDELAVWTTGLGWAGDPPTGMLTVQIGGTLVPVESVQPVPQHAGVFSVSVRVPETITTGDAVPIQLTILTPDSKQMNSNIVTAAFESVRQ